MFSYYKLLMFMLACSSMFGCSSTAPRTFISFDEKQDFSQYRSFAWMDERPIVVTGNHTPVNFEQERIVHAIELSLQSKGYELLDQSADADFVVTFTMGARDKMDVSSQTVIDYYGSHWRWGYQNHGFLRPEATRSTEYTTALYTEGSLAVDIFDVSRKSPIWHGMAIKNLSEKELQGDNREELNLVVQELLSDFPVMAN